MLVNPLAKPLKIHEGDLFEYFLYCFDRNAIFSWSLSVLHIIYRCVWCPLLTNLPHQYLTYQAEKSKATENKTMPKNWMVLRFIISVFCHRRRCEMALCIYPCTGIVLVLCLLFIYFIYLFAVTVFMEIFRLFFINFQNKVSSI